MNGAEWPRWSRPCRRRDLAEVAVDGECVVFDHLTGRVHRLDGVASAIWPFLDGSTTLEQLASDVSYVWGLDVDLAVDQLQRLASSLAAAHLLEAATEMADDHAPRS